MGRTRLYFQALALALFSACGGYSLWMTEPKYNHLIALEPYSTDYWYAPAYGWMYLVEDCDVERRPRYGWVTRDETLQFTPGGECPITMSFPKPEEIESPF